MDEDPAGGVRRKKDSSLVRAAELVRDGKASAMVSAGNTGATMAVGASAHGPPARCGATLHRHAAAPPRADAGRAGRRRRQRRVHPRRCWCSSPRWAPPTSPPASGPPSHQRRPALHRRGALQGHPARQGDARPARRPRRASSSSATSRAGTSCPRPADVIVTDGFTGNVALKALEGSLRFLFDTLLASSAPTTPPGRRRRSCSRTCCRWPPSSSPRTRAAPCCSGPTESA